jgi:acyl carrier protein
MVPSTVVLLEHFPLLPNGKVNRKALPAPDQSRPELEAAYVAPRTPTEEALSRLWEEILGLKRVGVHDNFFELGGHSLMASGVISRIHRAFQIEIGLRALFEKPTVAGLATAVDQLCLEALQDEELDRLVEEIEQIPEDEAEKYLERSEHS